MNKMMINLLDTTVDNNKSTVDSDYVFNGNKVPRVTKILSKCIHSDSLMYWANSLGFKHKSYKKTLDYAAFLGTECHESIDKFFDNKYDDSCINYNSFKSCAFESFMLWWNDIHIGNNINVLMHEKTLTCKYFGGTLDGLYEINGKKYLIDYKTSNHITFKYCLQLAAYRYMLRNTLNIEIDGAIILQVSKTEVGYNEYYMDLSRPDHLQYMNECEEAFMSLVYAYYNINNIESKFKMIDWRK